MAVSLYFRVDDGDWQQLADYAHPAVSTRVRVRLPAGTRGRQIAFKLEGKDSASWGLRAYAIDVETFKQEVNMP